jgi:hypothetical protein
VIAWNGRAARKNSQFLCTLAVNISVDTSSALRVPFDRSEE